MANIQKNLSSLTENSSYSEAFFQFWKDLGYPTDKTWDTEDLAPQEAIESLDSKGLVRTEKAGLSEWKNVCLGFLLDPEDNKGLVVQEWNNLNVKSILFLGIRLKGKEYNRSFLADIVRELNQKFAVPIVITFSYGDKVSLGITQRRFHKKDKSRKVLGKIIIIKDISGTKAHRAHMDILSSLQYEDLRREFQDGNELPFARFYLALLNRFNTKSLNERFYQDIASWYEWAMNEIKLPIIPDHLQTAKNGEEENKRQFLIRLICRMIFCWFLKERNLIHKDLLEIQDPDGEAKVLTNSSKRTTKAFLKENSYYRGILQNIFFKAINTTWDTPKRGKKAFSYYGKEFLPDDFDYSLFGSIPYLNGGLFDLLEEDNCNDTIANSKISIPNVLFYATENDGIISGKGRSAIRHLGLNTIFSCYKFTIEENTPQEEDVALDPELLGHVFENLLATVNTSDEDASKSAKKAKGAFYTPRRIIDYIITESLHLYLRNRFKDKPKRFTDALPALLYHGTFDTQDRELAQAIVEALEAIKILDPACGSGAFPMGALHKIVEILRIVDPDNTFWLELQIAKVPNAGLRKKIADDLKNQNNDYTRKLGLIQNAIYGVDIEPLAILITKLRFFISLLVEQKIDKDQPNYGLQALPNLETKIICANTLLEFQPSMFQELAIQEYAKAREAYYSGDLSLEEKEKLALDIAKILSDLIPDFVDQVQGKKDTSKNKEERNIRLLREWFQHSTIPAPFFHYEIFFPELKGIGFNLIIGNPPYGGDKIPDSLKTELDLGSKDPYGAFISRFIHTKTDRNTNQKVTAETPLQEDGVLAFIVSDTFLTIKSHKNLREQILHSRLKKIIRVHGDTFHATVNTAILVLEKGKGTGSTAPKETELAQAWKGENIVQAVDLTNISIHSQHDRFLSVLYDTEGFGKRKNISTESCAVYYYPQELIPTNSNIPFFVASPKLYTLLNDTTATTVSKEWEGKTVPFRKVKINEREIELVKLGDIAEVNQGLATGDNDSYLFQNPKSRGNYRSIKEFQEFLLTEEDLEKIRKDESLRLEVIDKGISKTSSRSKRYFEGRYIVPYDKGGESDSDEGWLPNYYVPTNYFIDWSEWAVSRMKTLTIRERNTQKGKEGGSDNLCAVIRSPELYYKKGITFSRTGVYAPTYRINSSSPFDTEGSIIYIPDESTNTSLGNIASKIAKYIIKNFIGHTVHAQIDEVKEIPTIKIFINGESDKDLVSSIIEKQKQDPHYDYASHEQLEIDRLVYEAYGLNQEDIAEVETWYARRYPKLVEAQRRNLKNLGKLPNFHYFHLYCDESCHLPNDKEKVMVLGAISCPREEGKDSLKSVLAGLKKIKEKHGLSTHFQIKWTKVSPAKLDFYLDILELFFQNPNLQFTALVSPKKHLELGDDPMEKFESWYYDKYFRLLRWAIQPMNRYHIFVDVKDTRGSDRIAELDKRLADDHFDFTSEIVQNLQLVRSDEVGLMQMADLFIGAVLFANRDKSKSNSDAKWKFVQALEKKIGHPLTETHSNPLANFRIFFDGRFSEDG